MFGKLVAKVDAQQVKDYKAIEKSYQEILVNNASELKAVNRERASQKAEIDSLRTTIHGLKSKLTNDLVLISNLRRELEFTREHSRITEEENIKITDIIQSLFKDLKTYDAAAEKLRPHVEAFNLSKKSSKIFADYIKEQYEQASSERLTKKEASELNRLLTQDLMPYDGFMTFEKGCMTENLQKISTVSVSFKPIRPFTELLNRATQKVEAKPKTRDSNIQTDGPVERSQKGGSSSRDKESANNLASVKKIVDQYKPEHTVVNSVDRRSVSVKQRSIVPNTIEKLMDISQGDMLDNDQADFDSQSIIPSATDVLMTNPRPNRDGQVRSGRVSSTSRVQFKADPLRRNGLDQLEDKPHVFQFSVTKNKHILQEDANF